jgi:hypothetical protein
MPDSEREPEVIVASLDSKIKPGWMTAAGVILGLVLLHRAIPSLRSVGLNGDAAVNILLGAVCIFGSGISRRMYLSDVGVVRETLVWRRVIRRVAPWSEIRHVTLALRGAVMMAFFEVGVKGWKTPFSREHELLVRDTLDEMLPGDVTIEVVERK